MNYRQRKYEQGKAARDDIYMFLVKYFEQHGYAPSYEESGKELGLQDVQSNAICGN